MSYYSSLKITSGSSHTFLGYWGNFNILEKLGADLGRLFSAIWEDWFSGLKPCDQIGRFPAQTPLGTQLGVVTHICCVALGHLRVKH